LPEGEERQSVLKSVGYEAARTEPLEALNLAMEQTSQSESDNLISYASLQWAAKDPESAFEWAEQIADGPLRDRILAGITTVWGDSDPVAAATEAVQRITPGRQQDDAVTGIVQRWVQQDPETSAAWVAQFPDGDLKQTAMENVIRLWSDMNAPQVGEWLNGLSAGALRDTAVVALVGWMAPLSPAEAAQWAKSIGNDQERQRMMELVARE
jgi:hypothetical protein